MPIVNYNGYATGIEKSKIEKMDGLRAKYPFLEQIMAREVYNLFNIEEAAVDESILEMKCHDSGSEGPEAFDEEFYSVSDDKIRELGVSVDENTGHLLNTLTGKFIDIGEPFPSHTVKEALSFLRITPDFLVRASHLKYEVDGEHCHDVSLIVYRA